MDRMPDWRPIESAGPDGRAEPAAEPVTADGVVNWRLVAFAALCLAALAGGALALSAATPATQFTLGAAGTTPPPTVVPSAADLATPAEPELVVDVGGAVERPGLYRLPAGSRVGDAIAAAGGYSTAVDLDAAARRLNLAERLSDGAKVHVPRRGEQADAPAAEASSPSAGSAGGGGLIDVNHASQRELETLPGIGPVTAGKIIAAREEAPFASVDDLLARKVVGSATFEKIRALITTTP